VTRTTSPFDALARAITIDDLEQASGILEAHPDLRRRLDEPLPQASFGSTALLVAVQQENREMIDLLVRSGADINARSHWWAGGFGVLDNDNGLETYLIERGARVDSCAAARHGMLDRLIDLIERDPQAVNARGGDGQTPLHVAKTVTIAQYLLDHGADIDALDVDHESTPAQYLLRNRPDVARYLVSRGCRTDLLMAAALGDLDMARRLVAADPARIRMTVSDAFFPKRDPRAGGTIYIWVLGLNKTAAMVAREFGHDEVVQWLLDRSPDDWKLAHACELGDESLLRRLLAAQPDLARTLPDDGRRRLVAAAQDKNIKALRLMLAAGWPVDARGQHGATALHWAAFHGNLEMTTEILRHRPTLELKDDDFGGTPLGWGIYGSVHGWHPDKGDYGGVVSALLDAGAKAPALTDDLVASEAVRTVLRKLPPR
jgi:ankyrin repeat protein